MNQYLDTNRKWWDERVPGHARSPFYDLKRFKDGELSLMPLEQRELGDVKDKSLLHLQCHFGLDTLSWARLGARATGVDFSEAAVDLARSLSQELGIDADFVRSNIYGLRDILPGDFDIVFTSCGVLSWLPDLASWAETIAHFLKPGGTFYIAEIHPFAQVFYDGADAEDLQVHYRYFHEPEPYRFEDDGSYAQPQANLTEATTYQWFHSLGDVVNAVTSAGLRIIWLHEFPYACYQMFPFLVQDDVGWWRMKEPDKGLPMTFSMKATR